MENKNVLLSIDDLKVQFHDAASWEIKVIPGLLAEAGFGSIDKRPAAGAAGRKTYP